MRTIQLLEKAGADGKLHLNIPVEEAGQMYRLVIVLEPDLPSSVHPSWPPDFLEKTIGSIQDETFIRHPQGELQQRVNFDDP